MTSPLSGTLVLTGLPRGSHRPRSYASAAPLQPAAEGVLHVAIIPSELAPRDANPGSKFIVVGIQAAAGGAPLQMKTGLGHFGNSALRQTQGGSIAAQLSFGRKPLKEG